jgi:hypothetical protein
MNIPLSISLSFSFHHYQNNVKIIGYDKNGNMNKEIEVHENNLEIIKEDAVG